MKYLYFVTLALIISCGIKNEKVQEKSNEQNAKIIEKGYPKTITDLGIESWYDKSKWALYCMYCDDTVKFEPNTKIKELVTFASLDLRLDGVKQFNDTTELRFYFYYNDTLKCDYKIFKNLLIATGTGFIKGSDSIRYYTAEGYGLTKFWEHGDQSPIGNPLQPEVINFINNNKDKLNSWFRNEAIRRGVLKLIYQFLRSQLFLQIRLEMKASRNSFTSSFFPCPESPC
jgi:hypothetical protein